MIGHLLTAAQLLLCARPVLRAGEPSVSKVDKPTWLTFLARETGSE